MDITVDDIDTSEVIATTAYFVVAEALTNALKHAQATAIQVSVTQHERHPDHRSTRQRPRRRPHRVRPDLGPRPRSHRSAERMSLHSPPGAGTPITVTI